MTSPKDRSRISSLEELVDILSKEISVLKTYENHVVSKVDSLSLEMYEVKRWVSSFEKRLQELGDMSHDHPIPEKEYDTADDKRFD